MWSKICSEKLLEPALNDPLWLICRKTETKKQKLQECFFSFHLYTTMKIEVWIYLNFKIYDLK